MWLLKADKANGTCFANISDTDRRQFVFFFGLGVSAVQLQIALMALGTLVALFAISGGLLPVRR